MNKVQKNKSAMIDAVDVFLHQYQSEFSGFVGIESATAALSDIRDELFAKEEFRKNVTAGMTEIKYAARNGAENAANTLASALNAYAAGTGNIGLRSISNISIHAIRRFRDIDFVIFLNTIKDTGSEHIEALAQYGYTADDFEQFKAKMTGFFDAIGAKQIAKVNRISARKSLATIFEEASEALAAIDKIMESFRAKKPDLYQAYKSVRSINDLGKRKRRVPEQTVPQ